MQDLPLEIWTTIAHLIPWDELCELISVNRAFYDIVLDERYKNVEWVTLDKRLVKCLGQLQDRTVASRVRRLYIRPWFIQYLLQREALFKQSISDSIKSRNQQQSWKEYIWKQATKYYKPKPPPKYPQTFAEHSQSKINHPKMSSYLAPPKEIMSAMINAVKNMVNVTEYQFQWRDLPLNPETLSFLTSTRAAFHNNLSKLVLHARISRFKEVSAFTDFVNLSQLELHFDYDPFADEDIGSQNDAILVNTVAPFINKLKASLQSLTLASSAKGDHSSFLRSLGPFPSLRSLALHICINPEYLSDRSVVGHFLDLHQSYLTSITFRPTFDDRGPEKATLTKLWPSIISPCMANPKWLRNLDSLTFPALHLPTTTSIIQYTPNHLTKLSLFGRFLETSEVATVVGLLAQRTDLRSLSLDIDTLDNELFRLLANTLPGLYSLTLVLNSSPSTFSEQYFQGTTYQKQTDWRVYDLSIFHKSYRDDTVVQSWAAKEEHSLMCRISWHILPRVRSFKGRGHMTQVAALGSV